MSQQQKTREQVAEELKKPIRDMPAKIASGLFQNAEFQQQMNRYMVSQHVLWGCSLAVFFIGINYTMIWLTATFSIQPWAIAGLLTPIGFGYTAWQFLKYRRPPKPKQLIGVSTPPLNGDSRR